VIWSRYSTQITPVNYNLLAVNFFMAMCAFFCCCGVWGRFWCSFWALALLINKRSRQTNPNAPKSKRPKKPHSTGSYQLSRKLRHDYGGGGGGAAVAPAAS
jgi:hypothetical protein